MRFGLSDLEELPSLKEFEALAREALGSDEGVAPSETSDESVLDPTPNVSESNGDTSAQSVSTLPQEATSEAHAREGAVASDEPTHKSAAAGE
jgi:hypothetical protein